MSNQYLSFDVTKQSTPQQLITGRQGDSQLKFVTMLFWDGDKNVPYDLTGKQVAFEALKPDNTHVVDYEGITILDAPAGLVRYSFNEQVFSVAGTMQQAFFKITHTDSDNNVITDSTLEVTINILENRVEFGINSEDYLSEYDDLIVKVKKKFDDYAATVQDSIDEAKKVHDEVTDLLKQINDNDIVKKTDFNNFKNAIGIFGDKNSLDNIFDDEMNDVAGEIPDYAVSKISDMANNISNDMFNVGFITDNHHQLTSYAPHSLKHYSYIAALSRRINMSAIVANGDNVNGYYEKQQKMIETRQATSTLFERSNANTDVFFVFGNHDSGINQRGNNRPETVITESEIKKFYRTPQKIYGETRNGDSLYGYKDYPNYKVRIIWLNSFDLSWDLNTDGTYKSSFLLQSGYQNEQLKWFANTALKLPDDSYQVMIFTHAPLPNTFGNISTATDSNGNVVQQYNSDVLIEIINAFQNAKSGSVKVDSSIYPIDLTYDFTGHALGVVIGLFSGHIHSDGVTTYKGINCVETAASLCYSGDKNRVIDTLSEDCWDVISVDTSKRTLKLTRFGYGSDRSVEY